MAVFLLLPLSTFKPQPPFGGGGTQPQSRARPSARSQAPRPPAPRCLGLGGEVRHRGQGAGEPHAGAHDGCAANRGIQGVQELEPAPSERRRERAPKKNHSKTGGVGVYRTQTPKKERKPENLGKKNKLFTESLFIPGYLATPTQVQC